MLCCFSVFILLREMKSLSESKFNQKLAWEVLKKGYSCRKACFVASTLTLEIFKRRTNFKMKTFKDEISMTPSTRIKMQLVSWGCFHRRETISKLFLQCVIQQKKIGENKMSHLLENSTSERQLLFEFSQAYIFLREENPSMSTIILMKNSLVFTWSWEKNIQMCPIRNPLL